MKIALVHDWLTGMRGGEKCLEVFCELFPKADLFTLIHKKGSVSPTIEKMNIKTSFIQYLPGVLVNHKNYLPLFPAAIEAFNLKSYDLILSSSHCIAKGAKKSKSAIHICYCFTPMRYAWALFEDYFGKESRFKKYLIRLAINRLKKWDLKSNENIDFFLAISDNIKNRISKFYNRNSYIIYPPVEVNKFSISDKEEDFYLIVSALVPYKRIDLAVNAFNRLKKKLIIIGTGDCLKDLQRISGSNIEFLGWKTDLEIRDYYSRCKALIFPGEEDFGIVPVEAQACGKPVIAFAKGGVLETVTPATGILFNQQTPEALIEAVLRFAAIKNKFNKDIIRKNSEQFSREIFKQNIKNFILAKTDWLSSK